MNIHFCNFAAESEYQKANIMAKKGQLTTAEWLEYGEYQRLLTCLHNDKEYLWETYARLGFCTGCRISDILTMKWKDVLAAECTVIEKKTGKARKVNFNESVHTRLAELYQLQGSPDTDNLVFESPTAKWHTVYHKPHPFSQQHVNLKFREFKKRYGIHIGNFSSHTFRKTFGRYVYDSLGRTEESLVLLNKIFRHSSIAMTKVYIGITDDEIKSVFDSIKF